MKNRNGNVPQGNFNLKMNSSKSFNRSYLENSVYAFALFE